MRSGHHRISKNESTIAATEHPGVCESQLHEFESRGKTATSTQTS
jgi:hypothetical protein